MLGSVSSSVLRIINQKIGNIILFQIFYTPNLTFSSSKLPHVEMSNKAVYLRFVSFVKIVYEVCKMDNTVMRPIDQQLLFVMDWALVISQSVPRKAGDSISTQRTPLATYLESERRPRGEGMT